MLRCSAIFSSSPFVTCFIVQHFPIFFIRKLHPVSMTLAPATTWVQLPLATEALTHSSLRFLYFYILFSVSHHSPLI